MDPDGPKTMGALADELACDRGNVTGIVDRLEDAGLVARSAPEYDGRVRIISLTEEGARHRAATETRLLTPPASLDDVSADDLAAATTLGRILEGLRAASVERIGASTPHVAADVART